MPLQFQIPALTRHRVANEARHVFEREQEELLKEAYSYLLLFHQEHRTPELFARRYEEVRACIERSGTYQHTYEELEYGARVAWRNASRCIGRLHWQSLTVRDLRHLSSAEDIFEALLDHIRVATNGGKIRSTISVFAPQEPGRPGIRIWNPQLIRYAGFRLSGGGVLGDPLHEELTQIAKELGWRPERESPFTVLPLIIQMPGQQPKLFKLPSDAILEVPLSHPDYAWFANLGLKWHALPVISNMRMEIGGLSYTAAPFNGYYMGTEVGARNLGDEGRYNLLPIIAGQMGLNTRSDRSMWKDRALVELNIAVLHSFAQHGVTIVDHHTASRQFIHHGKKEAQAGRSLPADWSWIVPPVSGSTTPVFHVPYRDMLLKPNFFYQPSPWREARQDGVC